MAYTRPEDGDNWRQAAGPPSPQDGVPPVMPPPPSGRGVLLAATGAVAALVAAAVVVAMSAASSGGDGDESGGDGLGGAVATATTAPSNQGTVVSDATTTTGDAATPEDADHAPAGASLPPVTIPAESTPPTTIPGSEPSSIPTDISGGEAPLFGHLVVDLEPGGYLEFAVHLRTDQEVSLLSLADDGINTEIEVFAPDGSSEGWWAGGEPEVINGLEWYLPDEPLPATGTYVVRVIHTGGSDEPFALGFFGTP
jgi:hypothetical protein